MRSLVVFTHGGGRLSNQLINFGHLIAWVEENADSVNLINMAFWKYAGLFRGAELNALCYYPNSVNSDVFWRFLDLTGKALRRNYYNSADLFMFMLKCVFHAQEIELSYKDHINLGNVEFDEKIMNSRVTLLSGWGPRNWEFFRKHQQTIREFFYPRQDIQRTVSSFIQAIRSQYDILIGVLIRQDDYRHWANGKYFFETDVYVNWMENMLDMFPSQRVGFIIASDEKQDERKFRGINYHMATGAKTGEGHYLENLVELSRCDLVISPPSTFGAWAAFMGAKPLLPLLEQNQRLTTNMILSEHIFDARKHPGFSASLH